MTTVRAKFKELRKADAQKVSLVTRGANRIPFRIIKALSGEPMSIDLSGLRIKRAKTEQQQPVAVEVMALVVGKEDNTEAVRAALKAEGFSVDTPVENADHTVTFMQKGIQLDDDNSVVQLENLLVIAKGMNTEALDGFKDVLKVENFWPSPSAASAALTTTVASILHVAKSAEEAKVEIDTTLNDFSSYVTALTSALPAAAFKADRAMSAVLKAAPPKKEETAPMNKPDGMDQAKWDGMDDTAKAACVQKAEADKVAAVAEAEKIAKAEAAKSGDAAVAAVTALKGELATQLGSIATAVSAVMKGVEKNNADFEALKAEVAELKQKSEGLETKLKSTVAAPAKNDDTPPKKAAKAEDDGDPRTGCFDTGLQRHKFERFQRTARNQ